MCIPTRYQPDVIKTTAGSGQKNIHHLALISAMLFIVCCCFQITGAGWAAALPSSRVHKVEAGRLQLEGARLQLKGDIAGAVKKYRASLALKPDAQLEDLVKRLEKRLQQPNVDGIVEPLENLFHGELGKSWEGKAVYGGNFSKFAKFEENMLLVDVPAGNGWGKTGIRATKPLIKIPHKDANVSNKITFTIDPSRSSDFVFSLIPSKWGSSSYEWRSHTIRIGLFRDLDKNSSSLSLWIQRKEVMTVEVAPEMLKEMSLILRPDGLVLVTDAKGDVLLQSYLSSYVTVDEKGYYLYALAHAPKKDASAKLALINITREDINYTKTKKEDDPSFFLENRQKITLFDGRILDKKWIKYDAAGGDFSKHARLQEGMLFVDVPEGTKLGVVGIMSPDPIVWLDKFGEGAEVDVTYTFDSGETTGFVVALATRYSLNGNMPNRPKIYLHWYLKEGVGKADLYHNDKLIKSYKLSSRAPEEVTFALYPKGFSLKVKGIKEEIYPWSDLTTGQGLRLYAYTKADKRNMPVTMALKKIELERKAGKEILPPSPAENVAPLPTKVLFKGKLGDIWQESTIENGEFAKQAQFQDNRLVVNLPKKAHNGKRVGLLSKEPIFMLDERIQTTTYTVSIHVDPKETTGFQTMFSTGKSGNMWKSMDAAISLVCHTEGAMAGQCMLSLRSSQAPYALWKRIIDKAWLEKNWNGQLDIQIGEGWVRAQLADGPSVRGSNFSFSRGRAEYMTIYPYAEDDYQTMGATLVLEKITGQWQPIEGMTKLERWMYLDEDEFNPKLYLRDLKDALQ